MSSKQPKITEPAELFTPHFGSPDKMSFQIKDGNKIFEVTTHFNADGRQSVLQQFKELILSEGLIGNRTFDNTDKAL